MYFDNSHNSFLGPEYFMDFLMGKMDPMSGCDTAETLVLCLLPPREKWFQYVRREYATAINFPYIITLYLSIFIYLSIYLNLYIYLSFNTFIYLSF